MAERFHDFFPNPFQLNIFYKNRTSKHTLANQPLTAVMTGLVHFKGMSLSL
jgi:hypothetical protein